METKTFGFIVAGIGVIILALSFIGNSVLGFLPAAVGKKDILITGILFVIVGAVIVAGKSKKKHEQISEEVPIYHGNKIVGYRKAVV